MININPSDKYYSIQEVEREGETPHKIFGNKMFRYLIYNKWLITIHMDEEPWNFTSPVKIVYDERYRSDNEEVYNNINEIFELYPDIKNELDNIKNKINIDIICNNVILNLAIEFKNIFEKNNYNVIINCTDNLSEYKLKDDGFIFMITPQHYYNRKNMNYLENATRNGKCIFYFMEQLSARINDTKYSEQYMGLTKILIGSSIISFDYNKDNYNYFNNIIYLPPPIITNNVQCEKIYDILLIGLVNNSTRRKPILDSLKRFFKIKIVYGKAGQELTKIINQSKVVINLHYYNDNTLLEEVRLNEIINSDTHILSELPHIDVDAMKEKYKDRVTFINIIEKPNKIIKKTDPIVVELKKLLKKPNKKYEHNFNNDLTEKILIDNIRGSIEEYKKYKKYNEYPHLFHKYLLKIKNPNTEITYNIEKENKYKNFYVKNFAHLHCYDISKFHEIYDEYLDKIDKYFNIIITYSIGEIKDIDYTIIKIPNKGMDVGAKFCMIKYLNDKKLEYDYVMFLHSKSDPKQRKKYFQIVDDLNDNFIKNIHDYDSYFPDIKWKIIDGRLKMLSGNPEYENSNVPERNLLYRNELLKYLNCNNDTNIFTEGNVYILKNNIINKLFTDKYLYNILNEPNDFDYNWITYRYDIKGDIKQVYDEFKLKKLKPRDEKSFDGYIEHVFERIVMNFCEKIYRKKICIFHCGNFEIFEYLVTKFPNILKMKLIITYYDDSYYDKLVNYPNIIHLLKVKNKGMDIGPFLLIIKFLQNNSHLYDDYTLFYKFHTKSIKNNKYWTESLINDIININIEGSNKPIIIGSNEFIYSQNNNVNLNNIKNIYNRNMDNNLNFDLYYDTYNNEFLKKTLLNNKFTELYFSENFYKYYEIDLKCLSNKDLYVHWNNHGKNEFHRKSNVNYIKKWAVKDNYFVAGTMFGFNSRWLKIFTTYDLDYEYSILEEGNIKNINETKIHAWEYYFGFMTLLTNGGIQGYKDNILQNIYLNKYKDYIPPIFSNINRPFSESKIAFFMLVPGKIPDSGGYRTLLKYIKLLNDKGFSVDLYFGECWNYIDVNSNVNNINEYGIPKCENWFNKNIKIADIIQNIKNFKILDICKNNYYISFKCQRDYDIIVANAWQVAESVYENKKSAKKIYYIIQDREELFYPNNKELQNNVINTYKSEFNYYCITKYLYHYFKNTYNIKNITSSYMGVDLNIYKNYNNFREDSVIIPYYRDIKPGRKPQLVEKIIDILSSNNIKCYVYPYKYYKNINKNISNLGIMKENELNNLYNKYKVGIVFSNTNPSRLGFEMYASGLQVIEYDSEFTKYDMPNEYFTKIKNEKNIISVINKLFNKPYDNSFLQNIDIKYDYDNFIKFLHL